MLTPSSSTDDLDVALLEGLERHELEQLLIEASRKMREREHKLVVAANIGKALLEKNLSLRSGIMTSMESSSNLFGLSDIEAMIHDFASTQNTDAAHMLRFGDARTQTGPSSPQPMNSPPTTDIDINSQCENSPERPGSDITPLARPVSLPDTDDDYFSRPADSTATQNVSALAAGTSSLAADGSMWVASDAGLIVSQPCSPSASVSSYASHALFSPSAGTSRIVSKRDTAGSRHRSRPSLLQMQALEAQRQLAALGEQNDVLHQQISELQHEAESARFEGSKKLSRLNKELRGLKAELEAATTRNVELESSHLSARYTPAPRSPMRDFVARGHSDSPSSRLVVSRVRSGEGGSSSDSIRNALSKDQPTSDHPGLIPSTSNLEDLVRSVHAADGESALLAQLLAKIKELEETNSAMAKAEEDFGSRMGRAMQEDERLRDALTTVGQDLGIAATSSTTASPEKGLHNVGVSQPPPDRPSFITPSHSLRSLGSLILDDVSSLASPVSPTQKRRAPGNRHVIEHRKTVRKALRRAQKEIAADVWGLNSDPAPPSTEDMSRSSTEQSLGTYSIDLSASDSMSSSPRAKGMFRIASSHSIGLNAPRRPRIRITPSIEDLRARKGMFEEVIDGPQPDTATAGDWQDVDSPIRSGFQPNGSLSPADAMQTYSARLRVQPRGRSAQQESPTRNSLTSKAVPQSSGSAMLVLSPSQQMSFRPTARVRRSRSRSQSFGSEANFGQQAPSVQQTPDPFMSPSPAWHRPGLSRSPTSVSSQRGRTLGSELGSIFGGDDRKHDFDDDLPQSRRLTATDNAGLADRSQSLVLAFPGDVTALAPRSKSCSRIESDRPTAHVGRLVPRCDEEHEDDLECVLTQSAYGQIEEAFLDESLVHPRDAALFARVEDEEQGAWLADQPIIETGGLQDEDEPRSSQFDLINAVVEHQAVAWADDDDYGRNITQREAAKLGLLARSALLQAGRGARLLTGATRNSNSAFGTMTKAHEQRQGAEKPPPARFEIESAEQVEHRLRIEALLRRRRQQLLRERGYPEQWEPARKEEDELVAMYAPSPQRLQERRMQALVGGRGSSTATSPGDASPSQRDPRRSTQQWVRELACVSPTVKKRSGGVRDQNLDLTTLDDVRPEEAEFELLDCPTWKKQGGRGTDYFPTSFRARYRPTMVKQRVAHVSQLTYGWVEEWIQFAFVVFLAFVVMIEQGPNRNARRGKAGAAPQRIMN
ncbi:hypothetical protein PSEUBRA_005378 [Kalmanozyma brasiliensis GHG001]|uniref:uncharacterized protein n=1 Tax=Kalmanozyma brasiliensis (strain GHG001) TaxID=1365824 RepID=UPI0028682150|nr:uncharacterized protein PSEUBRA_005378 [Kalmanozyma brasiliensis GHG001]EST05119.2 hypothetical protein PSEUBRA_005378 [Kalmanozyma brasiliensis GHG001]